MFSSYIVLKICFFIKIFLLQNHYTNADLDIDALFLSNNEPENDVADFILSKGYLPKDNIMIPKTAVKKNEVNDVTYLLSKLTDEELVKLLTEYPKKTEYNLNDIVNIATNTNDLGGQDESKDIIRSRFRTVDSNSNDPNKAYFKLDNKPVNPDKNRGKIDEEALFKLKNILYSRPVERNLEDDDKKELLFDMLVSQLKSLCCEKLPSKENTQPMLLEPLLTDFTKSVKTQSNNEQSGPTNFMFLIINDDIPINDFDKDGLISVDPDSLDEKSSVLLLGPILQELNNIQLKMVMNKITKELSRPEYLPLLQQIADGNLDPENMKLMKSLVTGPETRRYIKPHRCNYQSKLAKVFGGPRWIICTGYLNLNQPSVYD